MSDSLWPHGLYSPLKSPGQNIGVGGLSVLQGIFPTQGSNPGLLYCRRILDHWATREALIQALASKGNSFHTEPWAAPSHCLLFQHAALCELSSAPAARGHGDGKGRLFPSTVVHPPPSWVHLQGWIPNNRTSLPQTSPSRRGKGHSSSFVLKLC